MAYHWQPVKRIGKIGIHMGDVTDIIWYKRKKMGQS